MLRILPIFILSLLAVQGNLLSNDAYAGESEVLCSYQSLFDLPTDNPVSDDAALTETLSINVIRFDLQATPVLASSTIASDLNGQLIRGPPLPISF